MLACVIGIDFPQMLALENVTWPCSTTSNQVGLDGDVSLLARVMGILTRYPSLETWRLGGQMRIENKIRHSLILATIAQSCVLMFVRDDAGEGTCLCLLFVNSLVAIIRLLFVSIGLATRAKALATKWTVSNQVSLRALFAATTVSCLFSGLAARHGPALGILLFIWCTTVLLLWSAFLVPARGVEALIGIHVFLNTLLLIGPVASYHINGRAWYDYGTVAWNPPMASDGLGNTWCDDYDPKYTPPFSWPEIGPVMHSTSCYLLLLGIFPPLVPLVAFAVPCVLWKYRECYTHHRRCVLLSLWGVGLSPLVYLAVWGSKVASWLAD